MSTTPLGQLDVWVIRNVGSKEADELWDIVGRIIVHEAKAEREACAVVSENYSQVQGLPRVVALNIAHMIRNRT